MEIIKYDDDAIEIMPLLLDIIMRGGIIAGPTDTVYGIFGRADDAKVIARMFEMKKRPENKALPMFVNNMKMARWYAYISDAKARLLETIWPGPVTAVFHHKEKLPPILTGGTDAIGLRIPGYPLVLELLSQLDVPLAQSSANISGERPAKTAEEAAAYFENQKQRPDLLIDGGKISGKSSVVIDLRQNAPRMLRGGAMTQEEFETLARHIRDASALHTA